MLKKKWMSALALTCVFSTGLASAQELFMYPNKGQSQEQLQKDKFECYEWAKGQTGFDPLNLPEVATQQPVQTYVPPPPPRPQASVPGTALKSGAAGALIGAGLGALLRGRHGLLTGTAVGGASGAVIGGVKQSNENRREIAAQNQAQYQAQTQAQSQARTAEQEKYLQQRDRYERALEACLEGRGYTIK